MPSIAAENVWQHASAAICRAWQAPTLQSIVRFGALEDSLALLHPMLSLHEVKARVVQVIEETADTKTFVLKPNLQWRGAGVRAGQFVRLRVEINGRRLERNYSLTPIPGQRWLAITVKRQGQVSNFLHQHVKAGSIVTISQALGEFVLPDVSALPEKILLLSAGSGITPVMAMLRQLQAWRYSGEIVFLHCCKSERDWIFASELRQMQEEMPNLRVLSHFSSEQGRMQSPLLTTLVPDLAQRATWMCGPAAWMAEVDALWQSLAAHEIASVSLQREHFAAPPLLASAPGAPVQISFSASSQQFHTKGGEVLLKQAENAGLSPKHGCRIGICRSCQCVKESGVVENVQTGEISSAPNELIRLCISVARSDTTITL